MFRKVQMGKPYKWTKSKNRWWLCVAHCTVVCRGSGCFKIKILPHKVVIYNVHNIKYRPTTEKNLQGKFWLILTGSTWYKWLQLWVGAPPHHINWKTETPVVIMATNSNPTTPTTVKCKEIVANQHTHVPVVCIQYSNILRLLFFNASTQFRWETLIMQMKSC